MSETQSSHTITIRLNGETRDVPSGLTVDALLAHLSVDGRLVVVERNREILRRPDYGSVRVEAGDEIELVHFVGGG